MCRRIVNNILINLSSELFLRQGRKYGALGIQEPSKRRYLTVFREFLRLLTIGIRWCHDNNCVRNGNIAINETPNSGNVTHVHTTGKRACDAELAPLC